MNKETLEKESKNYLDNEGRAGFYDIAVEIADSYPLQASIIILAVWNIAGFRFTPWAKDKQHLKDLREAIDKCKPWFEQVKGKNFRTVNFDEIEDTVKRIYSTLSEVKCIKYTAASKVMHMHNRHLFLMWDSDMRKEYGKKFHGHTYKPDADSYMDYHRKMQEKVKNIEWNRSDKTLPKVIDEFNYMTITYKRKRKRKNDAKTKSEETL